MENKTALITGAAKNIGAAIAKKLHNVGMNVIVHYNNSENEAIELIKNLNDIRNNSAIAIQADLEKNEDKNLKWRKYVNERLKSEYKKLFAMIDDFVFIKIPNFDVVLKWRFLQEKKLKKRSHLKKKVMSYKEIKRFIMFYQRITLQMIKDLSKSASVVMIMKKNHKISKILFRPY